jgi:glyoxylate reductase
MKPRVLVTRHVYPAAIAVLQEHCIVDYVDSYDVLDETRLLKKLQHAHGVVCQLTDPMNATVIAAAPHLRVIAQIAVGVDNIAVPAATARKIVVTNTPGVLTEATFLRDGKWKRWDVDLLCGSDVHGRTLGLVGFGGIGKAVARRARGFSMRVLYASRTPAAPEVEQELQATKVPLDLLLAQSDFVSLHVPLSPETRHLIGVEQLCRMKRSAFLINTSRGPVVDEAALTAALEEGLPHVGSATASVRTLMCTTAARNCVAVLTGERPPNPVNPEVLA